MQVFLKEFFRNFFIQAFIKVTNYPFQRARILQQLQPQIPQLQNENLNSFSQCLKFIIKREGEEGIFAGIFYHVHRFFPEQLFSKLSGSYIKKIDKIFDQKTQQTRFQLVKVMSGTLTAGFSLLFLHPFDLVQFKLLADIKTADGLKSFQGIIDCFYQTIQNDGILGLYKGFGTTLTGAFLYRLFYFKIYDFLTFLKLKIQKKSGQPNSSRLLINFISSITASSLTYPLDTIRKYQMVLGNNQNFIKIIVNSIRQGSFRDLFRGHLVKLMEGSFPSLLMSLFIKI